MDFERYRVPASVREGVWIELPGTKDARFLVALPSEHNRAYQAAVQKTIPVRGEGNKTEVAFDKLNLVEWQGMRIEAFLEHCILELPTGITKELMRTEYFPGLVALFNKANDLSDDEAKTAKADLKKSPA
jgi:hypothetical protein